jgi:N-acetyl-alpha-D-muramate 1-phosphate uridylyltransferase
MKAMILAAGLGTRLRPLTDTIPKALVKVNGIPLLEQSIRYLQHNGVHSFIINIHHLGEQIIDFLAENSNFGSEIAISDERDQLLDTGGGLKKAAWFFPGNDPFIVYNVDVIADLDLLKVEDQHVRSKAIATLVVRTRETSRYFLFDKDMHLCGWENRSTGVRKSARVVNDESTAYAFSGIQVLSPSIFPLMTEEGPFSLTDLYLRLAAKERIVGFIDKDSYWIDIGKPHKTR